MSVVTTNSTVESPSLAPPIHLWLVSPTHVQAVDQMAFSLRKKKSDERINGGLGSTEKASVTDATLSSPGGDAQALTSPPHLSIGYVQVRNPRAWWNCLQPCLINGQPNKQTQQYLSLVLLNYISLLQSKASPQERTILLPQTEAANDTNSYNKNKYWQTSFYQLLKEMSHGSKSTQDAPTKQTQSKTVRIRKICIPGKRISYFNSKIPSSKELKSRIQQGKGRLERNSSLKPILLWIYPTLETQFDYSWESRLARWEHVLLLAQSLAGYYSTLGGGFYFTRRQIKTAFYLSRQQEYLALHVLGDVGMAWKCRIHQAYDLIQMGQFRLAKQWIQNVQRQVKKGKQQQRNQHRGVVTDSTRQTIYNMCKSALFFLKRVQEAGLLMDGNLNTSGSNTGEQHQEGEGLTKNNNVPKMVDDFHRIRIVQHYESSPLVSRQQRLA